MPIEPIMELPGLEKETAELFQLAQEGMPYGELVEHLNSLSVNPMDKEKLHGFIALHTY